MTADFFRTAFVWWNWFFKSLRQEDVINVGTHGAHNVMVFINWKHFEATWEHLLKKFWSLSPTLFTNKHLEINLRLDIKISKIFSILSTLKEYFFLTYACVCAHVCVCMRTRVELPWHENQVREQFQESVLIVCLSWMGSLCYFWCLYASLANPWGSRGIPEWMKSWVIVCCCHGHSHVNDSDIAMSMIEKMVMCSH